MIRCVVCGCSRLDSENVGCVLCGGSPSVRTEPCDISEDTKTKLLAHADKLKNCGVSLEVEKGRTLRKGVGDWIETVNIVLHVADSLHHGVLRRLVVFLRERKIAEEQIRRLRLDEPEKIMAFYGDDTPSPQESQQKRKNRRKRKTNRKPRTKPRVTKRKRRKTNTSRRRK